MDGNRHRQKKKKYQFAVEQAGAEFRVHPRGKYNHTSAVLRKPMCVGGFSLDGNRKFSHDQRNLNYITLDWESTKKVEFDLNIGLHKVTRRNYENVREDKINQLLRWLLLNGHKFHTKDSAGSSLQSLSTDFVCFRGLLRDLLCVPYEGREGWIICATKFRGTIYLCAYETPEKIAQRESETEQQKKMCSWGYKFEQYMTDGTNISEGVDENAEYSCVLRSRLESHSLVYSAEVDGVDPKKYKTPHADLSAFIELKTNKELVEERDIRSLHRYKLMKWWSQSFLVGIPTVVCGFRDAEGVVHSLKTFKVEDMPDTAKDHWQANVMVNFLNKFLTFVKHQVLIDDPQTVYKFVREANGGDITCKYLGKDANWSFLPKWYCEKMFRT